MAQLDLAPGYLLGGLTGHLCCWGSSIKTNGSYYINTWENVKKNLPYSQLKLNYMSTKYLL